MAHWARDRTIGQFRSNEDTVTVGLCDMTLEEAVAAGAKSLIIGIADVGGYLAESWHEDLIKAASAGLYIVNGGNVNPITRSQGRCARHRQARAVLTHHDQYRPQHAVGWLRFAGKLTL